MKIFIVVGTKENVYQDTIGGDFTPHPDKEIVTVFADENKARNFLENAKLVKPKQKRYGNISYYRGGYYDMEIEEHILN